MKFRILGCLEVEGASGPVRLDRPSDRKLLAALLMEAGQTTPLTYLIDVLWDDLPPASADKQVRNGVSRLRRALAEGGAPGLILTSYDGYRLAVDDEAVDACRFRNLVAQASSSASAGRIAEAAWLFESALSLWRGPFLAGLRGRTVEAAAAVWHERRCLAAESFYGHQLSLGHHDEVIAALTAFVAENPLRDKPARQLMLALYRCGRQADALAAYDRMRGLLADQLGLDPSAQLRQLHQQILTEDPALASQRPDGTVDSTARLTPLGPPRQLPRNPWPFIGREAELSALTEQIEKADSVGQVAIGVVAGTPGVGKTTLAVHWAHQVADRFPDGQLYANLRGFAAAGPLMDPGEVLRTFLQAFAVPPQLIPSEMDALAAMFRTVMAGKRVLVVLDNARDSEQVRPLLPGAPGCALVVTSRNELTGLIADAATRPLTLDLLPREDCRKLLTARIGAGRVTAEPQAADVLISSCARLPLALSVAAAHAATHPGFPLAALASELCDSRRRLDALTGDDLATDVRAVFFTSYQQLPVSAQRLFRLLGLHPGPDISTAAIASIAGLALTDARVPLLELARAHLITDHQPGRFACHDLLRAYAAELTDSTDTPAERQAAVHRMLDHYLRAADAGARTLNTHPLHPPPELPELCSAITHERLASPEAALTWFDAEFPVLRAVIQHAAATGWNTHAWRLPSALTTYLYRRGRWHDLAFIHHTALTAARSAASRSGQARAHEGIGGARSWLGQYDQACLHFSEALTLYAELGDKEGEATVNLQLGWIHDRHKHHEAALRHDQRALELYRAAGHETGQASALNNIGWCHALLGDYDQAIGCCRQALTLSTGNDNDRGAAHALDSLGYACARLGNHGEAIAHYQKSLTLMRKAGDRPDEARTLSHLGDAYHGAGDQGAACTAWREALEILEQLGHPDAADVQRKLQAQGVVLPRRTSRRGD